MAVKTLQSKKIGALNPLQGPVAGFGPAAKAGGPRARHTSLLGPGPTKKNKEGGADR